MIGVYSFWSNPYGVAGNGYPTLRHFYISLVYSALNSRNHFDKVVMYCLDKDVDTFKRLECFDHVIPAFEEISSLSPFHWAVAKMDVYRRQTEPFWHIDNDVHLTKPEIKRFFNHGLVVQSYENWDDFGYNYGPQIERWEASIDVFPPKYICGWKDSYGDWPFSTNAGVIGGTDVDFFQRYANDGVEYMLKYGDQIPDINTSIEQLYFTQRAYLEQNKIVPLLTSWRATEEAKHLGYYHFWGGTKRAVNPKTGRLRLDETGQQLPPEYQIKIAKAVWQGKK